MLKLINAIELQTQKYLQPHYAKKRNLFTNLFPEKLVEKSEIG